MGTPPRNSPCPCGSGRKWKRCHGRQVTQTTHLPNSERPIAFDPMASLLEKIVRPQLLSMRRAAVRLWLITMDDWVEAEKQLSGFDTERLERLIDRAWDACTNAICSWDPRFSFQVLRTLPPEIVECVAQLYDDPYGIAEIIRITTASSISSNNVRWPKLDVGNSNCIFLSHEQYKIISEQSPDVLGRCIGAASLLLTAQRWYRWAGKGNGIQRMPKRLQPQDYEKLAAEFGLSYRALSYDQESSSRT